MSRSALALLLAALAASPAHAQWVAGRTAADGGRPEASARAEDGARIRLWMDAQRRLHAAITLAPALLHLDPDGCPTLQIDERQTEDLSHERHLCTVDAAQAALVLGEADEGQIESPTLRGLMNGSRLTVRYRFAHAGYGASSFSLRGSKQVLTSMLDGITVAGDD